MALQLAVFRFKRVVKIFQAFYSIIVYEWTFQSIFYSGLIIFLGLFYAISYFDNFSVTHMHLLSFSVNDHVKRLNCAQFTTMHHDKPKIQDGVAVNVGKLNKYFSFFDRFQAAFQFSVFLYACVLTESILKIFLNFAQVLITQSTNANYHMNSSKFYTFKCIV